MQHHGPREQRSQIRTGNTSARKCLPWTGDRPVMYPPYNCAGDMPGSPPCPTQPQGSRPKRPSKGCRHAVLGRAAPGLPGVPAVTAGTPSRYLRRETRRAVRRPVRRATLRPPNISCLLSWSWIGIMVCLLQPTFPARAVPAPPRPRPARSPPGRAG